MRGLLLFPLHGAFLVIAIVTLVVVLFAFVDALSHPEHAYAVTDKQSKTFWLAVLGAGMFLTFLGTLCHAIGLIAALIYLADVRPAVRGARGGRS